MESERRHLLSDLEGLESHRRGLLSGLAELNARAIAVLATIGKLLAGTQALEANWHERRSRLEARELRIDEIHRALTQLDPLPLPGRAYQTPGRSTTTVEIALRDPFDWRPSGTATIGDRTVAILTAGTTSPGTLTRSMVVRAELDITLGDLRVTDRVAIACEGGPVLTVEVGSIG
jgi:hypothetical protein